MNALAYLIPISFALGLCGLGLFLWTMQNNQYDDLEGAAERILNAEQIARDENDFPPGN